MKSIEAVKVLHHWCVGGRYLFRLRELGLLFGESGNTLKATVRRLVSEGVLERICRDVYKYALTFRDGRSVVGDVAAFLRPGRYTYESFESAASQWGLISQVPMRVTCATTGAPGEYDTPYGTIELTHVDRPGAEIVGRIADREPESALPIASRELALDDLLACKRTLELIDWEEVEDDDRLQEVRERYSR